ncbi:MAG: hypothetical protein DWQ05_21280 [Calditrichaeota bacterium]|nr:MAG: hypothetical protein DWQ05_21280 [Calditrichota bacterium]
MAMNFYFKQKEFKMKNLFFVFIAILLCAGLTFAQTNNATVNQTGDENDGDVTQTGATNTATVDQYGKNLAEVDQTGTSNNADVDQGTAAVPRSNNHPPAYVGDHEWGAWIEQVGNTNTAVIDQQGNSGSADIYQLGNLNEGYQEINTFASGATSTTRKGLDIDQIGDENWANQKTVASFGSFGIKKMYVDQIGDNNLADQYSKGGMQSTMEIRQEGNGNDYTVDVSATGKPSPLAMSFVDKPAGDFTQYQNGRFSTASIDILGDDNHTAQYQEYTVWSTSGANYAEIDILGDFNNAAQGQIGENNTATIDMVGDANVGAISQTGSSHIGDITQTGNNNTSSVIQSD